MNKILDVCCGSRMFWFNKENESVVFVDKRIEIHNVKDSSQKGGIRTITVKPNIQADFTALPFQSNYFHTIVFDPPHLETLGEKSWMALKYGRLTGNWREMLRNGFSECFRVLENNGTLIFKWNEYDIKVSEILRLTNQKPLFGHRSGKHSKTHWITFNKTH